MQGNQAPCRIPGSTGNVSRVPSSSPWIRVAISYFYTAAGMFKEDV